METDTYIAALEREGELLLAAASEVDLDALVPSCPAWTVRDLLTHLGLVHRWATGYVADALTEMVEGPDEQTMLATPIPDESLGAWFAEGHADLVAALGAASEDLRCWTFLSATTPRAFWSRRQAHETAVHRIDGQLAASMPVSELPADFAVDGLDELLCGFLSRHRPKPSDAGLPTIAFEATDHERRFVARIGERGIEVDTIAGPVDLVVRGRSSDLYRFAWNRSGEDARSLELSGDATFAEAWRDRFRVNWS